MKIETLVELEAAADARRAVTVPASQCWAKPKPARFVLNLNGAVILRLFRSGMFLHESKTNEPK